MFSDVQAVFYFVRAEIQSDLTMLLILQSSGALSKETRAEPLAY